MVTQEEVIRFLFLFFFILSSFIYLGRRTLFEYKATECVFNLSHLGMNLALAVVMMVSESKPAASLAASLNFLERTSIPYYHSTIERTISRSPGSIIIIYLILDSH